MEWYTGLFSLEVTRQLCVRFSMDADEARALLLSVKHYVGS